MALKPLHLDVEYRMLSSHAAAQAARVPPNVDDDLIGVLAPAVMAAHQHSSDGREPLWTSTVPSPSPEHRLVTPESLKRRLECPRKTEPNSDNDV